MTWLLGNAIAVIMVGVMIPRNSIELENQTLRRELVDQWFTNHAEHCGALIPPWPHRGHCKWPMPEVLAMLPLAEIHAMLLEVSGQSSEPPL